MSTGDQSERLLFALEPRGADPAPGMLGTLAQAGGTLVGAIVNGLMRTWLADQNGQLTLVMWPRNFNARIDPLEIVDGHDQTVAHGGRRVLLAGGYLKTSDPSSLGHREVFCAWQASEADDLADTPRPRRARRRPFRDSRLPTTQRDVAGLLTAVAQACSTVPWVREAYICRLGREFTDDGSHQMLLATFVVTDCLAQEREITSRQLLALLPSSLQEGGIHVQTDNVVDAGPLGVQVYERSELGPPA